VNEKGRSSIKSQPITTAGPEGEEQIEERPSKLWFGASLSAFQQVTTGSAKN